VVELLVEEATWAMKREERKKISYRNQGEEADFWLTLHPNLLYVQTMKSIPIYRGWKRVIWFSLGKTFSS
jgi:hypothetical protein